MVIAPSVGGWDNRNSSTRDFLWHRDKGRLSVYEVVAEVFGIALVVSSTKPLTSYD
jgi:hypothetical protein